MCEIISRRMFFSMLLLDKISLQPLRYYDLWLLVHKSKQVEIEPVKESMWTDRRSDMMFPYRIFFYDYPLGFHDIWEYILVLPSGINASKLLDLHCQILFRFMYYKEFLLIQLKDM